MMMSKSHNLKNDQAYYMCNLNIIKKLYTQVLTTKNTSIVIH